MRVLTGTGYHRTKSLACLEVSFLTCCSPTHERSRWTSPHARQKYHTPQLDEVSLVSVGVFQADLRSCFLKEFGTAKWACLIYLCCLPCLCTRRCKLISQGKLITSLILLCRLPGLPKCQKVKSRNINQAPLTRQIRLVRLSANESSGPTAAILFRQQSYH